MSGDRSLLTDQDRADIQALVLFGTKSPHLRYHFYRIDDAARARGFIAALLEPGPLRVNTAARDSRAAERETLVYLAFTFAGLRSLQLPQASLDSFPADFRHGARQRAISVIRDVTEQSARNWIASDDDAHMVVLLYAHDIQTLIDRSSLLNKLADEHGNTLLRFIDGRALPDFDHPSGQRVTHASHFGFSDGISEPAIEGERPVDGGPPPLKPGAFILGHPDPARAETNHPLPNPPALGVNGTFGALRIFEQDCDAFEDFLDRHSEDEASRELLAARLCGRWRNGVSLAVSPESPAPPVAMTRAALNDFDYRPTERHPLAADDRRGLRCPIGSHTRRANPRNGDTFGSMGNRIRLIRRGMSYGPPHVRGDKESRGMLGLFLCASLAQQFEFIMRHWLGEGLSARGLDPAEKDPFVGVSADPGTFTYRDKDGRHTLTGLSTFVTTRGAAYLFFPGIQALRLLAGPAELIVPVAAPEGTESQPPRPATGDESPGVPGENASDAELIAFVIEDIRRRIGGGGLRDAHPKHHGIVRAWFDVLDAAALPADQRGLRESTAHGIFAQPKRYRAYIRFSNGNSVATTFDGVPDLRGMAIKLFEVPGRKLLDDERGTHDFVLASHPRFFVPDLRTYPRFLTAPDRRTLFEMFPVLAEALQSHRNVLTTSYFSQTPYRCGPEQVKYRVTPDSPGEEPPLGRLSADEIGAMGADYLRESMARILAQQEVTMKFMVQLAPPDGNVDDATQQWHTPFVQVATITIPIQEFRSGMQMTMAANISFNPWHAIDAHQPLGSINQARRDVYLAIAKERRANTGVAPFEPTGAEL